MIDVHWPDPPLRVLWSRGKGCAELARAIDPAALRVEGNTEAACIEHRATLVVRRRTMTRFDLVPTAAPHDLDLDRVEAVVALVGGGPHSRLAARVTARLGASMGIPARMLCAYRTDEEQAEALTTVERLFTLEPTLEYRTIRADTAAEIMESLAEHEVAVLGAPAGNWLQRQIFGTGARLVANAPAGTIIVHDAPTRVFQLLEEPVYVSPHMRARDAALVLDASRLAVVDHGQLQGMVMMDDLQAADPATEVGDLMEAVTPLHMNDPMPDPVEAGGLAMPVVDDGGRLVGLITPPTGV